MRVDIPPKGRQLDMLVRAQRPEQDLGLSYGWLRKHEGDPKQASLMHVRRIYPRCSVACALGRHRQHTKLRRRGCIPVHSRSDRPHCQTELMSASRAAFSVQYRRESSSGNFFLTISANGEWCCGEEIPRLRRALPREPVTIQNRGSTADFHRNESFERTSKGLRTIGVNTDVPERD